MRQGVMEEAAQAATMTTRPWPRLAARLRVDPTVLLETALVGVAGLLLLGALAWWAGRHTTPAWAHAVEAGEDHVSLEALADTLATTPDRVVLIDVRPQEEFAGWHLPGAVNLDLPQLLGPRGAAVLDAADGRLVVLVSNGMVHPAQAWVELMRRGRRDVRVLEGGLEEFKREMLTPPSLRGPMSPARAAREAARFQALQAWLGRR